MILLPAIDIKAGRCVRLIQGDFATAHDVADDPLTAAAGFKVAGAAWVHMVDLDGAVSGRRENSQAFLAVAKESGLSVELGGGIRDMEAVEFYLQQGISRVVLGTAAIRTPALVAEAVEKYGKRIAVGIDAKDGQVMLEGWLSAGKADYLSVAKEMEGYGVAVLVFTDISRDGTLQGPNLGQLEALRAAVSCSIIASGGIKNHKDLMALADLGMDGAICGKAVYSGDIDLAQSLAALAAYAH